MVAGAGLGSREQDPYSRQKRLLQPFTSLLRHFCATTRASSWVIAEIGGNWLSQPNGLHASIIIFECEVAPISLRSGGMRGSSEELHASLIMSTDSDGSQRVAIAHITSARSDGSTSSSTTTIIRPM